MNLSLDRIPLCSAALLVGVSFFMSRDVQAIPPSPHPIEAVQPDGTKIQLYLRGSAKQNWYEDPAGFTVVRGPTRYVYALRGADGRLVSSGLLVGKVKPAAAGLKPGIQPSPEVIEELRQKALPHPDADDADQPKIGLVPAAPHVVEVKQPDGSKIKLRLRGDEKYHWYEDLDGYTVMEEPGSFVYAMLGNDGNLVPTRFVVGQADPAESGLKPHIRPQPKRDDDDSPMPGAPPR